MTEERKTPESGDYQVSKHAANVLIDGPSLEYRPPRPRQPESLPIGLLGCGGIAATHLEVYRNAGYRVTTLYDRHPERSEKLRQQYFPDAKIAGSIEDFFESDLRIVDLTPHPRDRVVLMEKAIQHGKHILSQKPFAVDLDVAERLVQAAKRANLLIAVNQNGRWAPHVSYCREAIRKGILGEIQSVDCSIYWDHNWCAGTVFDQVKHLLLYDFGIHWFDMICCYFGAQQATEVFAQLSHTSTQKTKPALSGQVNVRFGNSGQANLVFRGDSPRLPLDRTVVVGSKAALVASGPNLNEQSVELHSEQGVIRPQFETRWFNDGFDGTMSELMCAIEQQRMPNNSAAQNLKTLELCFSAVASVERNEVVEVGTVRQMEN